MRLIFAGTPGAAVPTLDALISSDHEVVAVLTRPPARSGRGRGLTPSPVAERARSAGLDVIEASSLKSPEIAGRIEALDADLAVVVAYGALVPQSVLDMPRHGWINLHFSDLPRWRGAAPVQWSILAGDQATASCVFQLEAGLDTGPVFSRLRVDIGHETAGELLERMARLGADQVLDVVDAIADGTARAVPQEDAEGLAHARRLDADDGFIDFAAPADAVDRRIRAVSPNPGAHTLLPDGRRLKLGAVDAVDSDSPGVGVLTVTKNEVRVGCASGEVRLGLVAPAGKGWMDAPAWGRGARLDAGAVLGSTTGGR
ncbi:methionyl-tRNA formyltransferase [Actinomyces sp. B33]|uniref:methionyl-tRNA formyltransferase n=1 Tax=Actinomyces sp. B33 TaxID=2942131 RepID=UPI002341D5B6|nr:methionyl-tRNA formyltransferase [Actinomyces sp. B33]MDC4233320.1 methionyl-tRNA formyltransferase [Actinomyces sp. B33]